MKDKRCHTIVDSGYYWSGRSVIRGTGESIMLTIHGWGLGLCPVLFVCFYHLLQLMVGINNGMVDFKFHLVR